jgi:aquaporin Z
VSVTKRKTPERKARTLAQKLGAEALGTFLITLTATSVDILYYTGHHVDYVSRWLARGFITAVVAYGLSEISGAHCDPAITIGFTLRRVFAPAMLLPYWVAQFAGGFAAAGLLAALFGRASLRLGASHPGPGFGGLTATICEIVLTFVLMITILLTGREKAEVGKQSALAVGFAVAACGLFAGPISGASMNPARSISPQILGGSYGIVWIYAVGPVLGAALAVFVHRLLCGKPNPGERQTAQGDSA